MMRRGFRLARKEVGGSVAWIWERVRMPRIDEGILDTVVYLYPSRKAAVDGERAGGSGLLFGLVEEPLHVYAVTASHVAKKAPVVRANSWKEVQIHDTNPTDWIHHPDGDDLAACHLICGNPLTHGLLALDGRAILTEEHANMLAVGPGDTVYMIGRFLKVEGRERNTPAMRFGHIAMQPTRIHQEDRGIAQLSFLVEMHSLPGYSGSPVFLLIEEGDSYGGKYSARPKTSA